MAEDTATDHTDTGIGPVRRGRRLLAAGILSVISGGLALAAALLSALVAATLKPDDHCDSASGFFCYDAGDRGGFMTFAAVVGLLGSAFLVAGIGGCRRTRWGQFSLVALGGLGASWVLAQAVRSAGSVMLLVVAWLAVIAVLAGTSEPAPTEKDGSADPP